MKPLERADVVKLAKPWPLGGFITFCPVCGDQMVATGLHDAMIRRWTCDDCRSHGHPAPDNGFSPDKKLGGT